MNKYKIYLNTEDYSEINEIDESIVSMVVFHFRRYRTQLKKPYSVTNHKEQDESAKFIMNCFDNIDNSQQPPLFNDIIVNHVDNKIEINCA